ncbi:MAG: chemotaxis protein CheW [Arcobacteraceae bacterium]|jgi:purine-binding chemotaxis protein CheW|nr:chemotaxis protein CheW [Arcobacteraceae bacterium]
MDTILYDDEELLNPNSEQYFLFISGGDKYAFKASVVSEILENQSVTKVPKCITCVKGILNIRGNLVGVVDLLDRFDLDETQIKNRTSIVIIKLFQNEKEHTVGILIDEIFEVDGLDEDSLTHPPSFGTKIDARFIQHMARYGGEDIIVLDENEVLNISELSGEGYLK